MDLVNITYNGQGTSFQNYDDRDNQLIVTNRINALFGDPNDYLEFFVYDQSNEFIAASYNAIDYYSNLYNSNGLASTLELDPKGDLNRAGYYRGTLQIQYNFLRTLFNSSFGAKYWIKDISPSRTELRLSSQVLSDASIQDGFLAYQAYTTTKNYYSDFYLNFGLNQLVIGINAAYEEDDNGSYLLIKLYEPLPPEFGEKDELWLVDKVADSALFTVDVQVESAPIQIGGGLRGPNFKIPVSKRVGQTTPYYNISGLYSGSYSGSIEQLLSFYDDKAISINVDFTNFENFVHFSNAESRVRNFAYKVGLIETYTSQIAAQNAITNGDQASISASITTLNNQINNIVEKFDIYEYYLYYQSESFAWPKRNSTKPYQLYSVTSSQVSNWLGAPNAFPTATTASVLYSASMFDYANRDQALYTAPLYIQDDPTNQPYLTFLQMVGQHFDNIWVYYKDLSNRYNATNDPNTGISKDLVAYALQNFGFPLYTNTSVSDNLYYSLFGINADGSLLPPTGSELITQYITSSIDTLSADDIQKEFYKRLYHNLPYILKTKGTRASIDALITCFGIPEDILTVNEFGGFNRYQQSGIYEVYNQKISTSTGSLQLSSSLLSPYATLQYFETNNRLNTTDVEVGFSPSDKINENISASLGYFNIDQLIGAQGNQYSSSYFLLDRERDAYFSTYTFPHKLSEYIRLIKFYNNSLFKTIKEFIPARANLSSGFILKPHVLERDKYARHDPDFNVQDEYTGSIDPIEISGSDGGAIQGSTAYSGSTITPIGVVSFISSDDMPKYTGELSGSTIDIYSGSFSQLEQSSNSSGSGLIFVNYGATLNNVSSSVRSKRFYDLDYTSNQITPVNFNLITQSISNSIFNNYNTYNDPYSPYSYLQDFGYYTNAWTVPRYYGSRLTSALYTSYSLGDVSYGKTAAIDKIKYQYAYLVDIFSSSFQLPGRANAQIKYMIDNDENVLDLTKENNNIFVTQNVFKSQETANVSLFDYNNLNPFIQKLTNNTTFTIYEGGYRYSPILFNIEGSGSITYELDNPLIITSSVTTPSTTTINPGDTNYWTINDLDIDLDQPNPSAPVIVRVVPSAVVGTTSTLPVNINLQIRNTSATPVPFYSVPIFQIPAGTSAPYTFSVNLPTVYTSTYGWTAADVIVVNNLIEQQYDPSGGTTTTKEEFIYTVSDSDTCWYAQNPREIILSATQSLFYGTGIVQSGSYPGIDTPVFDLTLDQMDLIRLYNTGSGWSALSEYRVVSVDSELFVSASVEYVKFTIDRDLNLADASGSQTEYPAKICKYLVLKRLPDETNVILSYNLGQPITQDGLLLPQYIDPAVRDNSGNVIKSLKQQNLI